MMNKYFVSISEESYFFEVHPNSKKYISIACNGQDLEVVLLDICFTVN